MPQGPAGATILYGLVLVPVLLGKYPEGIPFLFIHIKEKEDVIIGCPRVSGFI